MSDALLAESVHQAVQGNPTRTASTLDAIAAGEAPPPELDVVRTPRTGIALTHRLVMLLDGTLAGRARLGRRHERAHRAHGGAAAERVGEHRCFQIRRRCDA